MRLWSIDPAYLDAKGLVALWREGLLALAVLEGRTRGYRHHPQLERFRNTANPAAAVRRYLWHVYEEACARGYRFDAGRIGRRPAGRLSLEVTRGQLRFELEHLKSKLRRRDPSGYRFLQTVKKPRPHPMFVSRAGGVESWEKDLAARMPPSRRSAHDDSA